MKSNIRIMTWNILANCLAVKGDMYKHVDAPNLLHANRLKLTANIILTERPDILCLQEVDNDHYTDGNNDVIRYISETTGHRYAHIFEAKYRLTDGMCVLFDK